MQSISLLNISFSYPRSDELFSNMSVVFDNQHKIAIIGDNGTGKTTLLQLISSKLDVSSGKIVQNAAVHILPQIVAPDAKSGGQRQQDAPGKAF